MTESELLSEVRRLRALGQGKRKIGPQLNISPDAAQRLVKRIELDDAKAQAAAPSAVLRQPTLPIAAIFIGSRIRRDKGDIAGMARSINENFLLHPVVVCVLPKPLGTVTHELIAGERRILGWQLSRYRDDEIPVHIITIDDVVRGEEAENRDRKDFTPSEVYELKRYWEAKLRPAALERQRSGKASEDAGEIGARIGEIAGRSRETVNKIAAIMEAAQEDAERFGRLAEQMEKSGKVDGPFKRLQIMRQVDAMNAAPATLPSRGPYACAVIDFPWPHEPDMSQEDIDAAGRSLRPYAAMSIVAGMVFMREKVAPLLGPDCVVWFWTTNFHMPYAFALLSELGFGPHSTIGTWLKARMGRGQILRDQTEHCIIVKRGKPLINLTNQTTAWTGWKQPTKNSRKPDEFYRMVEELCPAPRYADIFSFGNRGEKWDCFGDQAQRMAGEAVEPQAQPFGIYGDSPLLAPLVGASE